MTLKQQYSWPSFSTKEAKIISKVLMSNNVNYLFGKKSDIWAYGLICYLVCINKEFTTSKLSKIFLGTNIKSIQKNICYEIKNNFENKVKKFIIQDNQIKSLKSFFISIFNCDSNKRPNSQELLEHKIFY